MGVNLKVTGLHPNVADAFSTMGNEIKARKLPFAVYHMVRTHAHQQRIYMKGREIVNPTGKSAEKPMGLIVSNAPAFWSDHEYGFACDWVGKDVNGRWTWEMPDEQWEELGVLGKALGLKWGGDWRNRDCPHFYLKRKINMGEVRRIYFSEGIDALWKAVV